MPHVHIEGVIVNLLFTYGILPRRHVNSGHEAKNYTLRVHLMFLLPNQGVVILAY